MEALRYLALKNCDFLSNIWRSDQIPEFSSQVKLFVCIFIEHFYYINQELSGFIILHEWFSYKECLYLYGLINV